MPTRSWSHKGVIAERGTHDELLARGGIYAGLWSRQREVDAAEEALRRADADKRGGGDEEEAPRTEAIEGETELKASAARDFYGDWRQNTGLAVRFPMSVVHSIRRQLTPIHPQGYVFVAGFAVATLILGWIWAPLGWIGLIATLWCAYFFRDPARVTPLGADLVVAPADGVVSFAGSGHAAAGARPRHRAAAAGVDLHVGLRLPREPRAGRGPGQARSPITPARSSTPISTRRAKTTSATAW